MADEEIRSNKEFIYSDTDKKTEWKYYDENCNPIHTCKVVHKDKPLIVVYPYGYSRERGLSKKKIEVIELRGWDSLKDIPNTLKSGENIRITVAPTKHLMSFLYKQFPEVEKLVIEKNGKSRFSKKTITFCYQDFEKAVRVISRETKLYEVRRKTGITNSLSELTPQISSRKTSLPKGAIANYFSFYSTDFNLSNEDMDAILSILTFAPKSNISITENFIQTKDKINVAYLDDVIDKFNVLISAKNDNEKDWQKFFEKHGWILAGLFPFQVILRDREAYVGGKTIENKEGRVVDFLFQNGFKDNYALLEIKTHNKKLLESTPYREPDTYAAHKDLSGAISQCLDQKNTFLTQMGQAYKILDPKIILVTGLKNSLNSSQAGCFELIRGNQKNVDIVTFDELLEKIKGLKDIFNL